MEREKFARVDALLAAVNCPLCFEMVKDCVVTPCGHSFCRSCAGEAVSRKHTCPVCQLGVIGGESGLIRNFLVDEITQALRKSTDETDVAYMRLLFDGAAAGSGETLPPFPPRLPAVEEEEEEPYIDKPRPTVDPAAWRQQPQSQQQKQQRPGGRQQAMSPIEAVLVNRMRESFLGYQSYYARERAAHEKEVSSLSAQLAAAKREATPDVSRAIVDIGASKRPVGGAATAATMFVGTPAEKVLALSAAIRDSEHRFKAGMEALVRDFDAHAAAAAPPPSLLPSTVTVIVASRGVRFDTRLLPTHFPENVYDKIRAYYASSGDEVRGFGPEARMFLQAVSAANVHNNGATGAAPGAPQTHAIDSRTQTVFSQSPGGRIGAGWALVVDGPVLLASEEIKPCFRHEYGKGTEVWGEDRVDYFMCRACKLNWLCAACASHCHRDCRGVKPFMLNHAPAWACCYCSRASGVECKLADGPGSTWG